MKSLDRRGDFMSLRLSSRMVDCLPTLQRSRLESLQVNLGYRCNQRCSHCHVNAGPHRTEMMGRETVDLVIAYLQSSGIKKLDLTGGAPELNPHFRHLVHAAREMDVRVTDRCNLTVLEEPGQSGLAEFLSDHEVEVIASLPCYLKENVDDQRGKGVFEVSIRMLRKLNQLGYGQEGSKLLLNLVYNPLGPFLPPPQKPLEDEYRKELGERYGIFFHHLYTLVNMPIHRFSRRLISNGELHGYMRLLREAHRDDNLRSVMCRSQINIDWKGYVYDCDFNQMLNMPIGFKDKTHTHLSELMGVEMEGISIVLQDHCYGCTAGQGSSCGGALR
jgi:radical SAM/Cys-rich protein